MTGGRRSGGSARCTAPGARPRQPRGIRARGALGSLALFLLVLAPAVAHAQTEVVEYYATDALGSIRVVFDANGVELGRADYLPFGEELSSSAALPPERFTGQVREGEAGKDYFHARMYQTRTGRFDVVDPVYGDGANPQAWNRYAYALSSPANYTDPLGLCNVGVTAVPEVGGFYMPGCSNGKTANGGASGGFPGSVVWSGPGGNTGSGRGGNGQSGSNGRGGRGGNNGSGAGAGSGEDPGSPTPVPPTPKPPPAPPISPVPPPVDPAGPWWRLACAVDGANQLSLASITGRRGLLWEALLGNSVADGVALVTHGIGAVGPLLAGEAMDRVGERAMATRISTDVARLGENGAGTVFVKEWGIRLGATAAGRGMSLGFAAKAAYDVGTFTYTWDLCGR